MSTADFESKSPLKSSTSANSIQSLISDVNWEHLIDLEIKSRSQDAENKSATGFRFYLDRLDLLRDQELHNECVREFFSVQELRELISDEIVEYEDVDEEPSNLEVSDDALQLWVAVISEYRRVAAKIPYYIHKMVVAGIPPALRGPVWSSLAEAHSDTLESLYDSLASEWTKAVDCINRDLNRTFPEIKLFQQEGGEGQIRLGRLLQAYAAYDVDVGYCQGLTFIAGPLLLHMSDREAFCLLAKLMEDSNLRSMFTSDMSGLPLRLFQFQQLFDEVLPELSAHFTSLGVPNIYASKWFLSLFASTAPFTILMRMYDLVFCEGVLTTLMRTAVCLLKSNQALLMSFTEEDQILQHLLNRDAWDVFGGDGDLFMRHLSSIDTGDMAQLNAFENAYKLTQKMSRLSAPSTIPTLPSASSVSTVAPPSLAPPPAVVAATSTGFFGGRFSLRSASPTRSLRPSPSLTSLSEDEPASRGYAPFKRSMTKGSISSGSSISTLIDSPPDSAVERFEGSTAKLTSQIELETVSAMLEFERRGRAQERELLQQLIGRLSGESLTAATSQFVDNVKSAYNIGGDACARPEDAHSGCSSCERLRLELEASRAQEAIAKANEAISRSMIDELKDEMKGPAKVPAAKVAVHSAGRKGWW